MFREIRKVYRDTFTPNERVANAIALLSVALAAFVCRIELLDAPTRSAIMLALLGGGTAMVLLRGIQARLRG